MRMVDINSDGDINQEEATTFADTRFTKIDTNGDEQSTVSEFRAYHEKIKQHM